MKFVILVFFLLAQSCSDNNEPSSFLDVRSDMDHEDVRGGEDSSQQKDLHDADMLSIDMDSQDVGNDAQPTLPWELSTGKHLQKRVIVGADPMSALCNDGTHAVMYYRIHNPNAPYIIFLEGGGFCNNLSSCEKRKLNNPQYLTSDPTAKDAVPDQLFGGGILSSTVSKNPDYSEANQIRLRYCSSDLWSGTHIGSAPKKNDWHFLGHNIVKAAIYDLEHANLPAGMSIKDSPMIILAGSSAGGMGVINNLDWLAARFENKKVIGFNDSGWIPEMNVYAPLASTPSVTKTSEGFNISYALWESKPDASCVQAHPNNKGLCGTTDVLSEITTPLFISILQRDVAMLGNLGVQRPALNSPSPELESFLTLFRRNLRTTTEPASGYFIPKGVGHVLNKEWYSRKISGVLLGEAFHRWEQDPSTPQRYFE